MAKIYISYQREDQPFVIELSKNLKAGGHHLSFDIDELSAGSEWRSVLDAGLKTADVFIVVVSSSMHKSQYVLTEVGAARAYAHESGRMLIIPLIIDETPPPLSIQDLHAIIQPNRDFNSIIPKIEDAISAFIGRRAAMESAATAVAEKIQDNAADYIRVAIKSLDTLERRDRKLSYSWYFIGFLALILGIAFSIHGLESASQHPDFQYEMLVLIILKAIVVIGLLSACAKYAFSLGKSYSGESLKSSDRIHAIRFGEFYLRAFGDKTKWEDLKEVFQHWNIDRSSSFSSLNANQFDPKVFEAILGVAKTLKKNKRRSFKTQNSLNSV
jgi:hypothetical protein